MPLEIACPLCTSPASGTFYEARDVPVTCASVFSDRDTARAVPTGDVRLRTCRHCGFVFNPAFDPVLGAVGARYESSQSGSQHFSAFARSLANDWVQRHGLAGKTVIEVGCGDGAFLRLLVEGGVKHAVGIDPLADASQSTSTIRLIADLLREDHLAIPADALVCRHTLEHVAAPMPFLSLLHRWSAAAPGRVVLLEVPDSRRVFIERAFWDVYYEHCNYFTQETLELAFELAGFTVLRSECVYGNQYLIVEAAAASAAPAPAAPWPHAHAIDMLCEAFGREARAAIRKYEGSIMRLASEGAPLVIWQGASKTVGFLSGLSAEVRRLIHSAVDVSPQRHGRFLPGSGLAVLDPGTLKVIRPRHVILMNPAYLDEVRAQIRGMNLDTKVHAVNDLAEHPIAQFDLR